MGHAAPYGAAQEGMKMGASGGMPGKPTARRGRSSADAFEPVRQCGPARADGTADWSLHRQVQSPRRTVSLCYSRPLSGGKGDSAQVVYARCSGLDVYKDEVTACVLVLGEDGKREVRIKEFRTYRNDLQRLNMQLSARDPQKLSRHRESARCGPTGSGVAATGRPRVPAAGLQQFTTFRLLLQARKALAAKTLSRANADCERLIGTVRRECMDQVIELDEASM